MNHRKLHFRPGDLGAVILVLALAAGIFLGFLPQTRTQGGQAQIYLNGQLVKTVTLSEDQEFTITDAYTNTVTVHDGKIAITNSDCPGTDCIHSGWISSSGRSIVCLPNGLEIRVISQSGDVDFIVG